MENDASIRGARPTDRVPPSAEPVLDWRVMLPVFAVVAIDAVGVGIVLPLLPFYSQRFGATPFALGALIASFSLCQFASGPVLGTMSDRLGRKPVLVASQVGTLVSVLILARAGSLFVLFVARMLNGLTAGNMSVASALAIDRSTPTNRKQALGVVSAAAGVGMIVGPAVTGALGRVSPTTPLWVAAGFSAASIAASIVLLPRERPASKPVSGSAGKTSLATPAVRAVLALAGAYYFALGMFVSGLALFLADRFVWRGHPFGVIESGFVFALFGLVNVFVQFFLMKRVSRRVSEKRLAALSFGLLAAGCGGIGLAPGLVALGASIVLAALGISFLRPTLTSAMSVGVPPARQGRLMGLNQSLMAIANVTAPLATGLLLGWRWYEGWALACAGIAALGLLGALGAAALRLWPESVPLCVDPVAGSGEESLVGVGKNVSL